MCSDLLRYLVHAKAFCESMYRMETAQEEIGAKSAAHDANKK
jgi:hypothetical protein